MISNKPIETPEGVTYYPWTDGYAVGFKAVRKDGRVEHLFLNPSGESDDDQPCVFLYHDTTGDPDKALEANSGSVCYVDMFVSQDKA